MELGFEGDYPPQSGDPWELAKDVGSADGPLAATSPEVLRAGRVGRLRLANRVGYELLQLGDNVPFPVEPAALDQLGCSPGIIEVSGRRRPDQVAEVGNILSAPG